MEGGRGGGLQRDGKANVAWHHATARADAIWNGGNSATPLALIGVAGLNLTLPEQGNTWVNSAGFLPFKQPVLGGPR